MWLLTQRLRWSFAVTGWTVGAMTIAVISGSWVCLGWSRVSETVAAILLGVAWTAFNAAIWASSPPAPPPPLYPPIKGKRTRFDLRSACIRP